MVKTENKPAFEDQRGVLAHRAKQRAYNGESYSRMQTDWKKYRVASRHA